MNKKLLREKPVELTDFGILSVICAPDLYFTEEEFDHFYSLLSADGKKVYALFLLEQERNKKTSKGKTLKALRKAPMVGANLDLKRQRTKPRKVKL